MKIIPNEPRSHWKFLKQWFLETKSLIYFSIHFFLSKSRIFYLFKKQKVLKPYTTHAMGRRWIKREKVSFLLQEITTRKISQKLHDLDSNVLLLCCVKALLIPRSRQVLGFKNGIWISNCTGLLSHPSSFIFVEFYMI